MVIDWFTVGAQALNFLVLVWLLKRFLYKPILTALDEREKRIASELAEAAAKRNEAEKEREELQRKNGEFDQHREDLLNQARGQARSERQRLMKEAQRQAEDMAARRQKAFARERVNLNEDIVRRTREEVFAIVRQTLKDLAGAELEQRMIEVFVRRLRQLEGEAKESFAKALKATSDPVLVRSGFELLDEQRNAIQGALKKAFSTEIMVRFETAPPVISGIELTANGRKLAWSIEDYLASLERRVGELLEANGHCQAEVEPELEPESNS